MVILEIDPPHLVTLTLPWGDDPIQRVEHGDESAIATRMSTVTVIGSYRSAAVSCTAVVGSAPRAGAYTRPLLSST